MDKSTKVKILLHCLGVKTEWTLTDGIENLSTDDWDEVIQLAGINKAIPLLYHHLRITHKIAGIPAELKQKLLDASLFSSDCNVRLYYELSRLLKALNNEGVPVIVLKGSALAELVYPSIALRPMIDIDLLVKGNDIQEADRVLSQLGYEFELGVTGSSYPKRHTDYVKHIGYRGKDFDIDLHSKIYGLPGLDPWINALPAKIASTDTFILGPEDFLLYLCLHLDHHIRTEGCARLVWWWDILELIKHYQGKLNWDYVIQTARKHKVEKYVHRVLHTIDKEFEGDVPADILVQLKGDNVIHPINDLLYPPKDSIVRKIYSTFVFITASPIQYKIYRTFRAVFPCRDYMIRRYSIENPKQLHFSYFVHIGTRAVEIMRTLQALSGHPKGKR